MLERVTGGNPGGIFNGKGRCAGKPLCNGRVQSAVRELRDELLSRLESNAEDVLRALVNQLHADINEISQYRRVCCRACHGEGHQYQCTPLEYQAKKLKHDKDRAKVLEQSDQAVDIGEFPPSNLDWYDKRREPNLDCPECFGEGVGEMYLGDTRKLSKAAMALYQGVKKTKDGIEIVIANREKVIAQLARVLGMFKDKETTVNVSIMSAENLTALFWNNLHGARDRQAAVLVERGIVDEDDRPQS